MVQKGVTSVKLAMEKLEHFLELGGTKKDITLLVISGIALIVSIFDLVPLPFDASWAAIILCGVPIILEAVIGLVTAFDIKADVLVSLAPIASLIIGETLFGRGGMGVKAVAAVAGSVIYRFIIALALRANVPSECLKLISAVIVALAIAAPALKAKADFRRRRANAQKGGARHA